MNKTIYFEALTLGGFPHEMRVETDSFAGHGPTGKYRWAITCLSEHRPRLRYGHGYGSPVKALQAAERAVAELESIYA